MYTLIRMVTYALGLTVATSEKMVANDAALVSLSVYIYHDV